MSNKKIKVKNSVVVYQAKNGAIELSRDVRTETIWASQAQISDIFQTERSVVTKHINNLLKSGEIEEKSNVRFLHIPKSDKPVGFYSLDIILSVGYRTNSKKAIEFRKWATKTLREYITQGYAINKSRIAQNYSKFMEAVDALKRLLPTGANIDTESVIDLIAMFSETWLSLDAYDKDAMSFKGATKKRVIFTAEKLQQSLVELKTVLVGKGEAADIFGLERQPGSVAGIVGNVMQCFGGKDLYGSVEEKAAHLLYFMVKNHPFVDGNKRSGAYSFVWFLRQAKILDSSRITPPALTALTILVAESHPKQKEKMIKLILNLLGG